MPLWNELPPIADSQFPYYISYSESKNFGLITVTNFTKMWSSKVSGKLGILSLKDKIQGLEIDDDEFIEKVTKMLESSDKLKSAQLSFGDKKCMDLTLTGYFGFPLKVKISFIESSTESFYYNVIQPLFGVIKELKDSQKELCETIVKKDREIAEFHYEKGILSTRHAVTSAFNYENYIKSYRAFEDFWNTTEIPIKRTIPNSVDSPESKSSQTKACQSFTNNVNIKKKEETDENNVPVKSEPKSNSEKNCQLSVVVNETNKDCSKVKMEHNSNDATVLDPSTEDSIKEEVKQVKSETRSNTNVISKKVNETNKDSSKVKMEHNSNDATVLNPATEDSIKEEVKQVKSETRSNTNVISKKRKKLNY